MVAAHSSALAGADGGWEALCRAYGVHQVADLAEIADTLELFALRTRPGRRPGPDLDQPNRCGGPPHRKQQMRWPTAWVGQAGPDDHDSVGNARGGADGRSGRRRGIATVHYSGLERAQAIERNRNRLAELLGPGLVPANLPRVRIILVLVPHFNYRPLPIGQLSQGD
jgi:hypothetical protein